VRFSFWPRGFGWGILAFVLTVAVLVEFRLERGITARLLSALRGRLRGSRSAAIGTDGVGQ
jgi:hypothetical protein